MEKVVMQLDRNYLASVMHMVRVSDDKRIVAKSI